MKFVGFLLDAGGKVVIPAIPAPRNEFESAVDAAQLALDSELATTRQIYDLVALATEEKNYIALTSCSGSSTSSSRKSPAPRRGCR